MKSQKRKLPDKVRLSLPLRERGLKYHQQESLIVSIPVAPFAGAWIEIPITQDGRSSLMSLPLRERGLKSCYPRNGGRRYQSLPLRERGLKLDAARIEVVLNKSLPLRERGLKSRPIR